MRLYTHNATRRSPGRESGRRLPICVRAKTLRFVGGEKDRQRREPGPRCLAADGPGHWCGPTDRWAAPAGVSVIRRPGQCIMDAPAIDASRDASANLLPTRQGRVLRLCSCYRHGSIKIRLQSEQTVLHEPHLTNEEDDRDPEARQPTAPAIGAARPIVGLLRRIMRCSSRSLPTLPRRAEAGIRDPVAAI